MLLDVPSHVLAWLIEAAHGDALRVQCALRATCVPLTERVTPLLVRSVALRVQRRVAHTADDARTAYSHTSAALLHAQRALLSCSRHRECASESAARKARQLHVLAAAAVAAPTAYELRRSVALSFGADLLLLHRIDADVARIAAATAAAADVSKRQRSAPPARPRMPASTLIC
mmetsp:Transcript_34405/g.84358  ORF Transcript_34405/g.84358 Transcript_34405/m.84358 type:complete len:174 (+) Transcript_34405:77-598(+)